MSNPFEGHVLPSPDLGVEAARELLRSRYGRTGQLSALGSHQDQNWLVRCDDGAELVLKISNPGFPTSGLHAQNAAMLHLDGKALPFAVPVPLPDDEGRLVSSWRHGDERLDVRLVTFVRGVPASELGHLSTAYLREHGAMAARTAQALEDFDHPGLDRLLQWDCRHAVDVVQALEHHIADDELRASVRTATDDAATTLAGVVDELRTFVVHADVTDVNVVAAHDRARRVHPVGLIDFGDISRTWLVSDPAVAAAGLLLHDLDRPVQLTAALLQGFHSVLSLTEAEVDALWPLVVLRAAACVVSSEQQAVMEPHNAYAQEAREGDTAVFRSVASVSPLLAREVLRDAVGLPAGRAPGRPGGASPLLPDVHLLPLLDRSSTSLDVSPAVGWEPRGPGISRHGEACLDRTVLDSDEEPDVIALGIDVVVPEGTPLASPFTADVVGTEPLVLRLGDDELVLDGVTATVTAGEAVSAGDGIGTVSPGALRGVHAQWRPAGIPAPPYTTVSLAPGWLRLCPDPGPVVGVGDTTATHADPATLLERRERVLSPMQEHYYQDPPRIERGLRHHLFDTQARGYLDVVNNVASIGHAHPRLTEAVTRQLRLLNTNSRFSYGVMTQYAERLVELLPEPLDTVFLVNSGSEALDLALRIITTATGADDVLAMRSAYHGWTMATDAITTSIADNPGAADSRPDWVHLVESPNVFRGAYRGPDAGVLYARDAAQVVSQVQASGRRVAGFVAEALYGNAGGVELPAGYLSAVYDSVRTAGGLCVADEVQVGFARTGEHFWAFEDHGVVPDVVCMAKATGNGMAIGAVVTRREIADAFAGQGSFFSSVGGSPVACVAGLTVLDVIRDEQLQRNAHVVGGHLRDRLRGLGDRHEIVAAVHGKGLYLGVELVRDRTSLEPATEETAALCERLLELGVVVQPTSDHLNVLKVKPPLCLSSDSADFFVGTLDRCLTDGW